MESACFILHEWTNCILRNSNIIIGLWYIFCHGVPTGSGSHTFTYRSRKILAPIIVNEYTCKFTRKYSNPVHGIMECWKCWMTHRNFFCVCGWRSPEIFLCISHVYIICKMYVDLYSLICHIYENLLVTTSFISTCSFQFLFFAFPANFIFDLHLSSLTRFSVCKSSGISCTSLAVKLATLFGQLNFFPHAVYLVETVKGLREAAMKPAPLRIFP